MSEIQLDEMEEKSYFLNQGYKFIVFGDFGAHQSTDSIYLL